MRIQPGPDRLIFRIITVRELAPSTSKTVALQKIVAHVHALAIRRLRTASRNITMRKFTISTSGTVAPLKVAAHAVSFIPAAF